MQTELEWSKEREESVLQKLLRRKLDDPLPKRRKGEHDKDEEHKKEAKSIFKIRSASCE